MDLGQYLNLIARAIVVILPLSICACQKAAPVDPGIEDEEYRVMTAVLKEIRFHRLLFSRDRLAVPHFSDTTDRPTYTRVPMLRKPIEFLHAKDTSRARALLNIMQNIFGDVTYYLAVGAQTLSPGHTNPFRGNGENFVEANCPEVLVDLNSKNQRPYDLLASRLGDSLIVRLVGFGEFSDWDDFYRSLPLADGLISLSRVGFSPDRMRAAVFSSWHAAGLGGGGRLHYLEKYDGRWKVIEIESKADE